MKNEKDKKFVLIHGERQGGGSHTSPEIAGENDERCSIKTHTHV